MLMSNSRNIVFHRKSDFHPTRKHVGFTPQFITPSSQHSHKLTLNVTYQTAYLRSPRKKLPFLVDRRSANTATNPQSRGSLKLLHRAYDFLYCNCCNQWNLKQLCS